MPEEIKSERSHKRLWMGATGLVLLAMVVALGWYLRSPDFQDLVRRKVIATLEDVSGGRVEMASFRWNLSRLTFEASDLTIHGLETADQLPYVHVDHAQIRLHIISFFQRQVSLQQVEFQHPVIHIVVHPNGTTNAPEPKVKRVSNKNPVQELFDLAIGGITFTDGMLLLNERKLPLDFAANDIAAILTYDPLTQHYDGHVQVGKMDVKYEDYRDVAAHGDLQFTLSHNAAEVKSFKLVSEQSSLAISGKLTDFNHPQLQVTYSGSMNIEQLGTIVRDPHLRAGMLQSDGSATYSEAAGYASTGRIAIRDLDYLDAQVDLRKAAFNSNFSVSNNHLALTRIAARLLSGQVTGEADIKNLMPSPPATVAHSKDETLVTVDKRAALRRSEQQRISAARDTDGAQQAGSARLRVSGLSLNELVHMISTRSLPLDKLNLAAGVSGPVNLAWKQSLADAFADLALDLAAPQQPARNQLPVSGNLRGRYSIRTGLVDLSDLDLATPRTRLHAAGSVGPTTVALNLTADSTSLSEVQPLLSAMGNSPLPVELGGEASFDGTLNGRLETPDITGHLQATNFAYLYTPAPHAEPSQNAAFSAKHRWFHVSSSSSPPPPPSSQGTKPVRIHIDQFSSDVHYSQSAVVLHHAIIQEGSSRLMGDGSAALDRGHLTPTSQFLVQAAVSNADMAEMRRIAGFDYPISGKLNFTLHANGTQADPQGRGKISLTDGQAYGLPVKSMAANIVFANHAAQLEDIRLQTAHGTVAGWAAYDFRNQGVKFNLTGQSIDLAEVPELQRPRLHSAGVADFTVKGWGTVEQPVINSHVHIASLVLNGDTVGSITAEAVTRGRQLTLTARSNFPQATLTLDGNVDLQGDMPGSATLRFASLDVNPFLPAELRGQVTHRASLDGEAQVSGPLKRPELLGGSLRVQQFSVEIKHTAVKSDGPIELSFAKQVITVQRCTLVSEDTHFTLTGTASLKDDRRLSLRANGYLNLKLAQTLDPDLTSYGVANLNLTVNGTASSPVMTGRVEVVHAGLAMIDLPVGLGDVNGTMVFNQDRLEVENLTGRMGGGHVKLGGYVTYGSTPGFDLTADGNEIRFRYSGISVTSDQTLHLTGTLRNASLTGNVTVTRFVQIPSSDLQFVLAQATAPASIPNPKSPLNNLHLEVRILSTPELTVQTSLAKLSGDVDLRLRGTGSRPVLLGRINIAEGDIKLGGTKYHLDRGDITFIDPVRIDPVLDVEATTRVRDYDITIGLHGTVERLNTTYRSDPPLSSDDIVSLLAFGRTQTESAMGSAPSSGFAESASGALLSSAINQTVGNRVSRIFGASTIRINPSIGGPDNDPNARLTVEQQVSNNVTFTYITNLARSAQQVIQFEYNVNSDYTVQGIRDENGVVSFDLLIRKRKR